MMFYKEADLVETSIGRIPRHWAVAKIDEIALSKKGAIKIGPFGSQIKKSGMVRAGVKVYGQENVIENDFGIGSRYISQEKYETLKNFEIFPGDVLITMMGSIGCVAVFPENAQKGIMDSHLLRVQLKKELVLPNFLLHLVGSNLIKKQIRSLSRGAIMSGLNSETVRSIKIPLPPLAEQQRIVRVLSMADLAIGKTDKVIAKTERLKNGLMQGLLTKGIGHKEYKYSKELGHQIPKKWQVVRLDDYAYIKGRIGWRGLKASEYTEKGPYLIANKHLINNKIVWEACDHLSDFRYEESREIQLKTNDIIISKDGTIGEATIVDYLPDKATINSTMMLIRVTNENLVPKFLFYFFQGPSFRRFLRQKVSGTSIPHLFQRDMKNLYVALPASEEQQQIVKILSVIDRKLELENDEKAKLEKVKVSLMDLLLTGKIGVKVD